MSGRVGRLQTGDGRALMSSRRISASHRHMSMAYLLVWLILICYGLLMMFSASYGISFIQSSSGMKNQAAGTSESLPVRAVLEADATAMARKQILLTMAGASLAIMLGSLIPFRQLTRPAFRYILYGVVTASLFYCRKGGMVINGARRWVDLGFISFQPSELAKIGAVFFLAGYFSRRQKVRRQEKMKAGRGKPGVSLSRQAFLDVTWPALLISVWIILTLIQPHLSGALIISLISLIVFFLADIPLKSRLTGFFQLLALLVVVALVLGFAYQVITKQSAVEYVNERFAHAFKRVGTFRDRDGASQDDRMQIEQAELALGSGGLTGKGLGRSVQKLNWLSEAHNDFILPVIGEELGFIGVVSVIVLFLSFLLFGILIARKASSHMAMLVAAGNTILITVQAFLNMAVSVSLIPTTGISLPFFSYGGTANFFFALASGLVLCVSKSAVRIDPDVERIVVKVKPAARKTKENDTLDEGDGMGYAV
ncbi:MAG: FtsW/RodA/SpoVE family cell cycle protein [Clostridiaceae bacterium]|nr:FtsW/RodA/SpoVE family cell cycle protein [Clostridiaceae bacterium]